MPWCEPCDAFYNPGSLADGGTCPSCGGPVDEGDLARERRRAVMEADATADGSAPDDSEADQEGPHIPWHFWVGVVAMVLYLGWRVVQGFLMLF